MNSYLNKISKVSKENLDKEHFFQDLLSKLYSEKVLTNIEYQEVQFQILELLEEEAERFNKGNSSSLKVETAEKLMLSICYTIGTYFKALNDFSEAYNILKEENIKKIFKEGKKLLDTKVKETKELLDIVRQTKITTDNYAYNDTIDCGIPLFFDEYDNDFGSHETPGSIDYPLALDKMELVGIEYIYDYLRKINLENTFCSKFNVKEINELLNNYDKSSTHLLINIFEIVLVNAIGAILIGDNPININIEFRRVKYLENKLKNLEEVELRKSIETAAIQCSLELKITDKNLIQYIYNKIEDIVSRIKDTLKIDKLEAVFIPIRKEKHIQFTYIDSEKMDDSSFRQIADEIRSTSLVKDKIKIIREEIHSLVDLIDILEGSCIFNDEFISLYNSFEDNEIVLLLKSIPNINLKEDIKKMDFEKEWQNIILEYINGLNNERKNNIFEMYLRINI